MKDCTYFVAIRPTMDPRLFPENRPNGRGFESKEEAEALSKQFLDLGVAKDDLIVIEVEGDEIKELQ